jgi:hypothetical protein
MAKRRAKPLRIPGKRAEARAKAPRIGDFEKGFYIAVVSFAVVLTGLLARGADYSLNERTVSVIERGGGPGRNPVFGHAMTLASRYDSRPYWHNPKLTAGSPTTRETADLAIEHLIPCESGGRTIHHLDSNGKMSYGILQFQDWEEWERVSGIRGDPDNSDDAIRMAEWGIEHGMIDHWGCARILGEY